MILKSMNFMVKKLKVKNFLESVSTPINDGVKHKQIQGYTGLLVNGVEVLNYKSKNAVYFGNLNEIDVVKGGDDMML